MPKRTPLQSVVVMREGKMVTPPLEQPFEFTKEEIDQIEAVNPAALSVMTQVDMSKEPEAKATEPAKAPAPAAKTTKAAAAGGDGL